MTTASGQRIWRVLVVDDEENLNWSLVNSLRKDQYAADGAQTGEEALRLMASQAYDVVISDVKMPGMDGFELLQWLRQNRPHTRVIMMTAFGSPTTRADALRGGVIAYLEKPFDLRTLKDELRRLTAAPAGPRATGPSETEGYDLLEVARVINLARRDIALLVEAGGLGGRLRFLRGELIWAEAGNLQGEDAFIALTTPRTGRVQPEPWDGQSPRNVTQPLSQLIHLAVARRERGSSATTVPPVIATSAPAPPPTIVTPAPPPTATDATSAAPAEGGGVTAYASTAALAPLAPAQVAAACAVLDEMAAALPASGGAILLRPDGTLVGQRWNGVRDAAPGAHAHLAACAQAALRALLLGGWGDLEDVQVTSQDRSLLLRRIGRTDRAALLILAMPRDADLAACRALLREREPALLNALR
jgi:CheY-like chemotaxis protein/predicted regulator of Ras-like GTPase activity (Roadblock/LC7/MglB family)